MLANLTIDSTLIMGVFAFLGYIGKLLYGIGAKITELTLDVKAIKEKQKEIDDDLKEIKKV